MLLVVNAIGVFFSVHTKKRNRLEQKRMNDMVFVQYNLRLKRNQLQNKTLESCSIFLDDGDASVDWVVETQPAAFDNEDLSWLDLDPLPQQQDVGVDVGHLPFGPGESSQVAQAQEPHIEDQDVEDGLESESDPEDLDDSDD